MVGEWTEGLRIEGDLSQPELLQFQILDDLWAEQTGDVRGRAHLEAGSNLIRDARPTHPVRALDHDDMKARLREVVRRDEAVVACPDDHSIE